MGINRNINQVNYAVDNTMEFDSNSSPDIPIRDTEPLVTYNLIKGNKF